MSTERIGLYSIFGNYDDVNGRRNPKNKITHYGSWFENNPRRRD